MAGGMQSEKLMVLEYHENRDRLEGERWSETETRINSRLLLRRGRGCAGFRVDVGVGAAVFFGDDHQ
jgi:hypothetical protein